MKTPEYQKVNPNGGVQKGNKDSAPLNTNDRSAPKYTPRRNRKGIGLVGTALSIGVGILIILATVSLYNSVINTYRITNMTWQMTQMTGALQRSYANSPSYDNGSLIAVLDGGGDIPPAARRVASDGTVSVETPFGGAVTFTGDGGQDLTVTINDLPEGACEKFLEGYVGVGTSTTDLESVTISSALTMPLTRVGIATGCAAGNNNDVVMVY